MTARTAILTDTIRRSPAPALRVADVASCSPRRKRGRRAARSANAADGRDHVVPAQRGESSVRTKPADYLYRVVSGSVRTYKILSDGRRQIGGFYLPGDIFGLEFDDEHALSAEAVTDAEGARGESAAHFNALAGRDASIGGSALRADRARAAPRCKTMSSCSGSRAHKSASPVSLLEMAERSPLSASGIELPMSRQDITEYLGLTDREAIADVDPRWRTRRRSNWRRRVASLLHNFAM